MVTILILSALGQFRFQRQCVVQQQYYQQPTYYYNYQQPVAQFVAINDYDLVGQQERLNLSQERENKIDKLINYIDSIKSKPIDNNNYNQLNNNYNQLNNKSIETQEDPPIKWQKAPIYQEPKPIPVAEQAPPIPLVPTLINDAPGNIVSIFKNSCVNCHANKSNKVMNLFTIEGKPNNLSPKQLMKIDFEIHSGRMPKKGGPLSNSDYTVIREWIGSHEDLIVSSLK